MTRPVKMLLIGGGVLIVVLLGWYGYTLLSEFNRAEMRAFEKAVAEGAESLKTRAQELAERAAKEGFAVGSVDACQSIVSQYRSPLGNVLRNINVRELVNLPKTATKEDVQERCIEFAKAVEQMKKLSYQNLHMMVCAGSYFQISETDRRTITPDPKGRGVLQTITDTQPEAVAIRPGRSKILNQWQVYNMGDGCVIVGDSKRGMFITTKVE
jgi:hypothetical protein